MRPDFKEFNKTTATLQRFLLFVALLCCSPAARAVEVHFIDQFGTVHLDQAQAVALAHDGSSFVGGFYGGMTSVDKDLFVRKYSDQGVLVWEQQFGTSSEEEIEGMDVDALGNLYVCGFTQGSLGAGNAGLQDAFIRKYDGTGQIQWTRQYGTTEAERATGMSLTSNGDLLVVSSGKQSDLRRYSPAGDLIWATPLSSTPAGFETAGDVAADSLGNVFVSGTYYELVQPFDLDAFITHFDPDGNRGWTETLSTESLDQGGDLTVDDLGNAFFTGSTYGNLAGMNSGLDDIFIGKYSATGVNAWIHQLGGLLSDSVEGVASDAHGGAFIAGWTNSGSSLGGDPLGSQDGYVLQFNASGSEVSGARIGTAQADVLLDIASNGMGRFIVSGGTGGSVAGPNIGRADAWLASSTRVPEPTGLFLFITALFGATACRPVRSVCSPRDGSGILSERATG